MAWTSEDLIASVKRRGRIPTAGDVDTAYLLAVLNEEMQSYIVPFITSQREDYFIAHYDVTLAAGTVSYRLPTRSVGQALREVSIINAQSQLENFPRVSRENLGGGTRGFYLDGNVLMLVVDNPANVGTLGTAIRMTYHMRPNSLVSTTSVGIIQSINTGTKQVTLTSAPGSFTSASLYDIVRARPGFESLAMDQSASVSGTTLTFANTLPSDLVTGDVVCLAGEANYPQVPLEIHPLLAQRACAKILEAQGDAEQLGSSLQALGRLEADAAKLLTPRVAGEVERIINRESAFRSYW